MRVRSILPFGLIFIAVTATENQCNPKACTKNVDTEKTVCGSDGLTYPNRCLFEKVRCFNRNITLVKRGPCKEQKPCKEWESQKLLNPQYKFQPSCKPDGSYAAAQCHIDAAHCWCVTPQGLPLPYTSVRWKVNTKPHCGRKKKSTRRSPGRKGRNRACKQPDKAKFNNNLINIFHTEWSRDHGLVKPHNNDTDIMVNEWKFSTMDLNNDGFLDKSEYMDLKRVTKKAVKPKRCAKNFPRSCDVNSDRSISLQEWVECLTRDGMDDGGEFSTVTEESEEDNEDYTDAFIVRRPSPHALINFDDDSSDTKDDEPTDCLSDRRNALMDGGQFYVPECSPDGRYKKVQCYRAAGYCFCVHEDTGKNIPGTSVKNGTPQCDQIKLNRPMKGCPDNIKTKFLKDLIDFLHAQMLETVNGTNMEGVKYSWIPSKKEQAATWSFVVFDKNKNQKLDRNEWKIFKENISSVRSLKKCGKKFPRYCDINKDRYISMTEWLDCFNVEQSSTTTLPISSRSGKKNPLSMLLED